MGGLPPQRLRRKSAEPVADGSRVELGKWLRTAASFAFNALDSSPIHNQRHFHQPFRKSSIQQQLDRLFILQRLDAGDERIRLFSAVTGLLA